MKKYLSLIGFSALILIVGWLGYQSLFAYLSNHTYYFGILSLGENRRIFISALICAGLFPIFYLFASSKLKISKLIMRFIIGAGIFGLIHSNIKGDPVGPGQLITIFNTMLLVSLGVYLILGFSAIGSWIERKLVKFSQFRWQEIFLTFGIGFCSFVIIVQILLGIGILYGIVSWILFLGLGFMIRYERHQLGKWGKTIGDILNNYKGGIISGEWNLNSKSFWGGKKIGYLVLSLPLLLSVTYLYMGIQNAFVPYSTAWDANHEYMFTPKVLAENAGIYRGNNDVAASMPGLWHQFLVFIFSLTGCTNGWFGLSPDNIAISMNNISAFLVLIFGIAIIFQILALVTDKKEDKEDKNSELKKGKNVITEPGIYNWNGITMGWYFLLLWLTGGMGAFLVIVDNKTDLGVMALSLLAFLAGLIFLQNRKTSNNKSELFKYILITGFFFGFAALAKITAFVDLVLFGLLLVGLWFSSLTSLGLGIMIMGLVRKFSILTSFLMISDTSATWMIIIGGVIFVLGFVVYVLKLKCRDFGKNFKDLLILGIGFLIPLIMLKLPWTIIGQINNNSFSFSNSLKAVFLSINTENKKGNKSYKFLAQNENIEEIGNGDEISDMNLTNSIEQQDEIDGVILGSKKYWNFEQCMSAGDIYSDEELGENMQEVLAKTEDLGRYIGYGWREFKKTDMFVIDDETANKKWFKFLKAIWPKSDTCNESSTSNFICEKNLTFGLMKILWPTSDTCYGFNHDAKVLCNNAGIINSFRINDLRGIYENGINNQDGEAGVLLKNAIDAYDKAELEGKIGSSSNTDLFHEEVVNLRKYYQSHSILSTEDSINIPYRYLVPLNISFNWSLQNLSSYYTDIGYFWIIVYILLIIALPYAIIKKDKILTSTTLTTLIGWGIRWIIGSAILWYGTVLISWSMITLAILWNKLLQHGDKSPKVLPRILIILIGIFFGIQILFNYLRIASQGANSVFVWYKGNVGSEQIIDDNLQQSLKTKYGYTWKNIFNLQFPQYNPIIHALANRDKNDGVTVAGTYIQYFLGDQRNVKGDGMLSDFWDKTYWKKSSNLDLCKTYWRLRNENTRYFIIDPNIGTVSMGEGNETLFYRFFAKLNADKSKIIADGAITTFIRFYTLGYLKLISTNNIGTKYAFTLNDDTIREYFGENLTDEELVLTRGKMAVLQYFDDANSIFSSIAGIFVSRIMNDAKAGIEDIANIYGYEVDSNAIAKVADKYINSRVTEGIDKLTQNERTVLITYINLYMGYQHGGDSEISSMVQNILLNSVTGGSQVFALELN